MSTFQPGQIAQHDGRIGIVSEGAATTATVIDYTSAYGNLVRTRDLTGWEPVEVLAPGHVRLRVDDLDPQTLSEWSQWAACNVEDEALIRVGRAFIAQQVETGSAAESDSGAPNLTIAEIAAAANAALAARFTPGPNAEKPPVDDEQPTSATVTLPCPHGCGGKVTFTGKVDGYDYPSGQAWVRAAEVPTHECPPAQPDEPTSFNARVQVVSENFSEPERWARQHDGYWASENGDLRDWAGVCALGTVRIGWDD